MRGAAASPGREPYDVLVLDAFSSAAIPVHLLTREAVAGYVNVLAPGGVIAVHISNRHLDLEPVVAAIVLKSSHGPMIFRILFAFSPGADRAIQTRTREP